MLNSCIDLFHNYYEQKLKEDKDIILNEYALDFGTYLYVNIHSGEYKKVEVNKNEDGRSAGNIFEEIAQRDYLSKLLDMNKPIDLKKIVQSNNCYSFVIKKGSLERDSKGVRKLTLGRIEEYYSFTENLRVKYVKDKSKLEILDSIGQNSEEYKEAKKEKILKIKEWIKNNIFDLNLEGKDYLKIYFDIPLKEYEIESNKYFQANLYNKNDYNISIGNEIYGVPNNNLGMNSKKPYLENKTRKIKAPYLITSKDALRQKLFFDYLMILVSNKRNYVYITYDGNIVSYSRDEVPDGFSGYFLKVKKGKEAEIVDFDLSRTSNNNGIKGKVENHFNLTGKSIENIPNYGSAEDFKPLLERFNKTFYNGTLYLCMFDPNEYAYKSNKKLEVHLRKLGIGFYQWIYKGNKSILKGIFEKITLSIIFEKLYEGNALSSKMMFSVRETFIGIITEKEREIMSRFENVRNKLDNLFSTKESEDELNKDIESVEEYSYILGQVTYYLLSQSEANMSNKTHSLVKPIIESKNPKKVKQQIINLVSKYSHKISFNSKKFNKIMSMVLDYDVENIDKEFLLGGYFSDNIMYKKSNGLN